MRFGLGLSFVLLFMCQGLKAMEAAVWHTIFYLPGEMKGAAARPYIEAYWQINPRSVYYVRQKDSSVIGKVQTRVILSTDTGIVNEESYILQTGSLKGKENILAPNILDLRRYMLPYGKVKIQIILRDVADSANKYSYTDTFTVQREVDSVHYSQLELLDTTYASTKQNEFQKNDRQQIPLCSNFMDTKRDKLNYYFELYGANRIAKEQYPLSEFVFLSKKEDDMALSEYVRRDTIISNAPEVRPCMGSFDISKLESGNYYLSVYLRNRQERTLASRSFFFQRLNTKPKVKDTAQHTVADTTQETVSVLNLYKTFVAKYTMPQVMAILKMMIPISDELGRQTIRNFLKKPDDSYMRYYIYNFFSVADPKNPEKAWKEYAEKVKEVNSLFGYSQVPGYETDRGMIYLKYGKPTDRIKVENESGTYPYEIWQYDVLNGGYRKVTNAMFLFYRPGEMVGDMRLLHSNVPNEIKNTAWRNYLYVNGTASGNLNARAEQYLGGQ